MTSRRPKTAARLLALALLLVGLLLVFPASAFALFSNGGFETGGFGAEWSTTTFVNPGLLGAAPFTGADIVRNVGGTDLTSVLGPYSTMSQGDPNTGNVLRYPLAGNYCAVVNFQGSGRNGNTLTQTDTTTLSDVRSDGRIHVQFGWAAVVQNPAHTDTQQPYVYVAVNDLTKGTLLYESFIFAGAGSIWHNAANSIQYTDWQVIDVAPGNGALDVGDKVEIEVTAAGCALGGHWGYVYVDHFGSFEPVTPHVTVADKTYDGTTSATITGGSLTGVQSGDDVSLDTGTATAAFDTPAPGTGKTVTVSNLTLSGADADKYILTSYSATTLADIIAASAIGVQAASSDLQPGHTTTVTATATDSSGNPVVGQTLTFAATDGSMGPITAVTDANGQASATFTAGPTDGNATVTVSAYGGVQGSTTLFVDGTPPTTTATNTQPDASSGWVDHGVSVSLNATDNGPGSVSTWYILDGGSQTPYTGVAIPVVGDRSHTLEFWSVDAAGNVETPHELRYVNIDTTAPTVTSSADGDSSWHDQNLTVTLDAADTGGSGLADVQYRLHGTATWTDASADQFVVPAPADGSNDGPHVYDYQAIDGAGNVTTGSCTVNIDTQPPVTNVEVVRDATTGDLTITFLPTDLSSGMSGGLAGTEYQVDGGAWVSGTQVVLRPLVDHSTDGPHTVLYRSTDAVGQTEKPRSLTVVLAAPGATGEDTYVPQTTVLGLTGLWRDTAAHLTFEAYEDAAGPGIDHTEYSTDNGATWSTGTALTIDAPADHSNDGPHLVCYRSVDKAGTVEPTHIVVVGIDTRKPTCTVSGASTAWRNKPLTLIFSAGDAAPSSGIAHIEWSTTAGNWWTAGDTATVVHHGVNQVLVRAVDDAGNVGDSQATSVRIDNYRPWTKGLPSAGSHRRIVRVRFCIYDRKPSCGRAKVVLITVRNSHHRVVARYHPVGTRRTNAVVLYKVRLPKGHYTFRVRATDIAGNVQKRIVTGTLVVS